MHTIDTKATGWRRLLAVLLGAAVLSVPALASPPSAHAWGWNEVTNQVTFYEAAGVDSYYDNTAWLWGKFVYQDHGFAAKPSSVRIAYDGRDVYRLRNVHVRFTDGYGNYQQKWLGDIYDPGGGYYVPLDFGSWLCRDTCKFRIFGEADMLRENPNRGFDRTVNVPTWM